MLASVRTLLNHTTIQKLSVSETELSGTIYWVGNDDKNDAAWWYASELPTFSPDADIKFNVFEICFDTGTNPLTLNMYQDIIQLLTNPDIIQMYIDDGTGPRDINHESLINTTPTQLSLQLFMRYGPDPMLFVIQYSMTRFPGYSGG